MTFNAGDVFDNQLASAKRPYGAFLVADGRGGFTLDESHIAARPLLPRELWVRQHLGRLTYSAYKLSGRVEEYLTWAPLAVLGALGVFIVALQAYRRRRTHREAEASQSR